MAITNHILLKFISQKRFIEDFLDGNLYMNSLYYFWNEYPLKEAKNKRDKYIKELPGINPDHVMIPIEHKLSPEQADMFEGTIGFNADDILKHNFGEYMLTDAILRSVGFKYCNTLCFYRLDYSYDGLFLRYDIPNMKEFGDYVAIIKDKNELQRRIYKSAGHKGIDFLCGDVHYRGLKFEGRDTDVSQRHHIVIKSDKLYDISDFEIKTKRDCFVKMDRYSAQKEWRVVLYRGVKDNGPYRLEIGDIRDIVEYTQYKDLSATLDNLFKKRLIKQSDMGYYGNIDRKGLREKYYRLGDNKAEMFCFVG